MPQVHPIKLATNLQNAWSEANGLYPQLEQSAPAGRCATRLRPTAEYRPPELITLRERIWNLFDDPGSSQAAQMIGVFMMLVIVVSSISFILQTVPELHDVDNSIWRSIEIGSVTIFSVEFAIRCLFSMSKRNFVRDALNWVDFIAICPFYFELIFTNSSVSSSSVFRVVRLVRIFRVFKISRYVHWISVFYDAIKASVHPLGILLYIMSVAMVIFSTAMYYAERGDWDADNEIWLRNDGSRSPYYSIPASFWWCIITMTTVGYGDDVPITATGRIIAANFNAELDKMLRQKDIDYDTLGRLRDELDRAYYLRSEVEKKLLQNSQGVWSKEESAITSEEKEMFKELGVINEQIRDSRLNLTEFMEQQIKHILNKNLDSLLKQIGETVQRQKSISSEQINCILNMVPQFVEEPNPWRQQTAQWFQMMTENRSANHSTFDQ